MTLKVRLFKLLSYSVADLVSLKVLSLIAFFIITQALPRSDIGIIGVVGGYITIFSLFSISPETIFFRDFPKLKESLNRYLTSFFIFAALRSLILIGIGGVLAYGLFLLYGPSALPLYLFGSVIIFSLNQIHSLIKETYYVSFKQKHVLIVNFILMAIQVGLVSSIFFIPNLLLYLTILLGTAILNTFVWFILLKKSFHFQFAFRETFSLMKQTLFEFSLWHHLSASMLNILYKVDTLVLSFFVSLTLIGDYTIALAVSNFFFILPLLLQKTYTVGLSNVKTKEQINLALGVFLKHAFIVSIAQFILYLLFGGFIISIFSSTNIDQIFIYGFFLVSGVTIMNMVRPLNALIINTSSLKKAFYFAYLPSGLIGIVLYFLMTFYYGIMGTAVSNIFVYLVYAVLMILYVKKERLARPVFSLFSREERSIAQSILGKVKR